jgi:2',3'-cyclic-nucleotide 2'-phosphodiesterase (5'-nucleotidase family)
VSGGISLLPALIALLVVSAPVFGSVTRDEVVFVYSNHVEEAIEPYGCGSCPPGGVARRGGLIADLRARHRLVVPLDGGNAVSLDPDGGMRRFTILVEAMNQMGYRAATPGANEVELGRFMIERYVLLADFPLVSANLRLDGGVALDESVAIESGAAGRTIFVTGVTEAETAGYGVTIGDPVEAVARIARTLPTGALLVVLAHVDRPTAKRIASLSPNLLILGYSVRSTDLTPIRRGAAVMGGLSGHGRHIVSTRWRLPRRGSTPAGRRGALWRMISYDVITMTLDQKEDPAIASLVRGTADISE